jgi:hypothetical protein
MDADRDEHMVEDLLALKRQCDATMTAAFSSDPTLTRAISVRHASVSVFLGHALSLLSQHRTLSLM